jgi:calcium-dependent protein kinase
MNIPDAENVIKTLACYEDETYFYTILEWLQGGDLFDFLNLLHPCNSSDTYPYNSSDTCDAMAPELLQIIVHSIMTQVLRALRHLHAQGLIHGDVKLENLMWKERNPLKKRLTQGLTDLYSPASMFDLMDRNDMIVNNGHVFDMTSSVKLIDFDFLEECKPPFQEDPDVSPASKNRIIGTDGYIAPERYLGFKCPKNDIYSAGVVMYALITGEMPYSDSIFDDEPGENVVGHPKMMEIYCKLEKTHIKFGEAWERFPEARDLCEQLLTVDVEQRPDALQALRHPWFLCTPPSTRSYPAAVSAACFTAPSA